MTDLQQLILRASEMKGRLAELGGVAEPTEEHIQEIDSLRNEYRGNEARQRALMLSGDDVPDPIETRDNAEGRDLRRLLVRANMGQMVDNIIARNAHSGAEAEIAAHYGLGGNQIPVTMLRNWESQPLQTRAAVVVPTDVAAMENQSLDYVFPMSVASFLGIDQPTVPVGDSVWPVITTPPMVAAPAEGATVAETDGIITSEVLQPGRLQASYRYSRESAYRFGMLETDLRESLSMGIMDGLDAQIVAGTNGLLGTGGLTARAGDAANEATFPTYRELVYDAMTVDGKYAGGGDDIRLAIGPATYAHAGATYRTANSDISALENLMMATAGVRVSAHIPVPATNDQDVIVRKGARRAMVAPLWMGLDIIYDEITSAATGHVILTAVALFAVKILRDADFVRRVIQVA